MRREPKHTADDNGLAEDFESGTGLCSTCKHYSTCTFPKSSDIPKLFCEEFECVGAPCSDAGIGIAAPESPEVSSESVSSDPNVEAYLGLCVNCENRHTCNHARLVGGVWFCEEYR